MISHEKDATKRLFAKVKYYIDNLTVKPDLKYDTKSDIFFQKRNSNYYIGTAGQKAFGRGDTIHRAHLSEFAFWKKPKEILTGLSESVPMDGRIVIETTANGRGNDFYDMWQAAKAGESSYTPHFIPWFIDKEYSLTKERLCLLKIKEEIRNRILEEKLTEEEQILVKHNNLTIEQIWWRRFKIWDLADTFQQEYPENDVDCFLQSGRPVFKTVKMIEKIDLQTDKNYLGGVDGAEGVAGGDNHCFAIIDPTPPAKVVYEEVSNEPIDVFCRKVADMTSKYKIRLGVEKNGVGVAHVNKLKELGVSFSSWDTTGSSRPVLISELEEAYRKEELLETYLEAKNELMDMIYDEKNKPVHPTNKHDDRVFARGVAWQQRKSAEPSVRFL